MKLERKSGILAHISSLPSPHGIGTLGRAAYDFVDFLRDAGQSAWQVLPIGHTSYGNSPYQSYSSYAGNPYFIDLDTLCAEGYIEKGDYEKINWGVDEKRVDYGTMYRERPRILKKAAKRLLSSPPVEYYVFLEENISWIEDYAEFMALKERHGDRGRETWARELRYKNENSRGAVDAETCGVYKAIQFFFFSQWYALKKYANGKGIEIIGDMPIYCASDSAEVWAEPEAFDTDEEYLPRRVAGCPPDAFSPLGQRWGNPVYNWEYIEKNGFKWWIRRLAFALRVFDTVRIDHFRGFDSYYTIDRRFDTAVNGTWEEGPKTRLFSALSEALGENLPIIAEDLGYLTDSVKKLREYTGYPGMKVLEFAFDSRESAMYLPYSYPENSVCYVGTHDNDTAAGWYKTADKEARETAREYFNLTREEGVAYGLMRGAMGSSSFLTVLQLQDILSLGSDSRMNTPSTASGNWGWRVSRGALTARVSKKLRHMTELYGRI